MKQDMQTQGHMNHKMSQKTAYWDTCTALLRGRLCSPLFLAGVFDSDERHMLNRGHRNGLSSYRLGCRLGCHLGSRFGCTLGSGFGTRLAALGAGLAGGLTGSSSPCASSLPQEHRT